MFEPEVVNTNKLKNKYNDLIFMQYGSDIEKIMEKKRLEAIEQQKRLEDQQKNRTLSSLNNSRSVISKQQSMRPSNAYNNDKYDSLLYVNTGNNNFYPQNIYDGNYPPYTSSTLDQGPGYLNAELQEFVHAHDVVLDDGAFIPPQHKGLTVNKSLGKSPPKCKRSTIFLLLGILGTLIALIVIAILLNHFLNEKVTYPPNDFWYQRAFFYHLNVKTFANDVQGPTGRFIDLTSRVPYIRNTIGANAIILSGFIENDKYGIRDFFSSASYLVQDSFDVNGTIDAFLTEARNERLGVMKILLAMDLYKTSYENPWFLSSEKDPKSTEYIWTDVAPSDARTKRIFSFNAVRNQYYRHEHGQPLSPMLNLTDESVKTKLKQSLKKFKNQLNLDGFLVTNSTNILEEFYPQLGEILNSVTDERTVWFTDNDGVNRMLNDGKVLLRTISIKSKVQERSIDLQFQINSKNKEIPTGVQPIWYTKQDSEDYTDYQTLQALEYFLGGNYFMIAGEEVQLLTGLNELMKWTFINDLNYETYCITNLDSVTSRRTLENWNSFQNKIRNLPLLNTEISKSAIEILDSTKGSNVLLVRRQYPQTVSSISFLVSFQTLNNNVNLVDQIDKKAKVVYDSKNDYKNSNFNLANLRLKNNQVLLFEL